MGETQSTEAPAKCQECAWPVDARWRPRDVRLLHWVRFVPLIAVTLAAIAVGVVWYAGSQNVTTGSNLIYPKLVLPAFDYAALQSIANGDPDAPTGLVEAIQQYAESLSDTLPGEHKLHVGFLTPDVLRSTIRDIGWPASSWLSITELAFYDDSVSLKGFHKAVTDPTSSSSVRRSWSEALRQPAPPLWSWVRGKGYYRPPPESTGGIRRLVAIDPLAVVASVALIVVGWWFAAALGAALSCFGRLRNLRRSRWIRLGGGAAAAVAIGLAAFTSTRETVEAHLLKSSILWVATGNPLQSIAFQSLALTDATEQTLDSFDDQTIAQVAVTATRSETRTTPGEYLAVRYIPESRFSCSQRINEWFPLLAYSEPEYTSVAPDDAGTVVRFAPGIDTYRQGPRLITRYTPANPNKPNQQWVVNLDWLGAVVVALNVIWLFTKLTCVWRFRRTVAKRRRRGRCVRCGHIVDPSLA